MPRKVTVSVLVALIVFGVYFSIASPVSKDLTPIDIKVIEDIKADFDCANVSRFADQITCVKSVQLGLKKLIPDMKCANRGTTIEPEAFLARKYGCCYDRARLLEKIFLYYDLDSRHVALYDKSKYGLLAMVVPGVSSHATLEVKTERGWMGVDSNELFVLLTKSGDPVIYADLFDKQDSIKDNLVPKNFYSRELLAIYGLYSRHGMFHGLNLPSPEINYQDFFSFNFSR